MGKYPNTESAEYGTLGISETIHPTTKMCNE